MMKLVADEIVDLLAPVIGRGMATSAITMQCRKMGILPENLREDQIGDFANQFQKPMQIFAGEEPAQRIISQIRHIR